MNPDDVVTITAGPWMGNDGVVINHPVLYRQTPQVPVRLDSGQVVIVMESQVDVHD